MGSWAEHAAPVDPRVLQRPLQGTPSSINFAFLRFRESIMHQLKSQTKTGKAIVRQDVKIGKDDVRTVRFVQGPKKVMVTGHNLAKITIMGNAEGGFIGKFKDKKGRFVEVDGRTPEKAFQHAVKQAWKH
jgi:hypothetical protein